MKISQHFLARDYSSSAIASLVHNENTRCRIWQERPFVGGKCVVKTDARNGKFEGVGCAWSTLPGRPDDSRKIVS